MTSHVVRAQRWDGGWELHVDGIGVTQVDAIASAERQVRDYIETITGVELAAEDTVEILRRP